jgi:hypothetical protein
MIQNYLKTERNYVFYIKMAENKILNNDIEEKMFILLKTIFLVILNIEIFLLN